MAYHALKSIEELNGHFAPESFLNWLNGMDRFFQQSKLLKEKELNSLSQYLKGMPMCGGRRCSIRGNSAVKRKHDHGSR